MWLQHEAVGMKWECRRRKERERGTKRGWVRRTKNDAGGWGGKARAERKERVQGMAFTSCRFLDLSAIDRGGRLSARLYLFLFSLPSAEVLWCWPSGISSLLTRHTPPTWKTQTQSSANQTILYVRLLTARPALSRSTRAERKLLNRQLHQLLRQTLPLLSLSPHNVNNVAFSLERRLGKKEIKFER